MRAAGPLGWLLLGVALAGAVLLVVADFSTISKRTIGIGACSDRVAPELCHTSGHASHAYALLILAPVALVMAWGAVVGRSRAAAVALAALGIVVLFIALVIDLPKLDDRRNLNIRYNDVRAHTGPAFKVELTGGVLLLLAGGLAVVRSGAPVPAGSGERQPRRRRDPEGDDAERARYQPPQEPTTAEDPSRPEAPGAG